MKVKERGCETIKLIEGYGDTKIVNSKVGIKRQTLIDLINSIPKDIVDGNITIEVSMEYDSYPESVNFLYLTEREETEEEYTLRKIRESKAREVAIKSAETRAKNKEKEERKEYERLKKKFNS